MEYAALDAGAAELDAIIDKYAPQAAVSIERCGKNAAGHFANMRGVVIDEFTAPLDDLITAVKKRGILTIGVGDGGNEIGMGNLKQEISDNLELTPCVTEVDNLVIASVSNWGAYGIAAYLAKLSGEDVLARFAEVRDFIARTVEVGSVDGISHELVCTVDGFDMVVEQEILDALLAAAC